MLAAAIGRSKGGHALFLGLVGIGVTVLADPALGQNQPAVFNSLTLTSPSTVTAGSDVTYSYSVTSETPPIEKVVIAVEGPPPGIYGGGNFTADLQTNTVTFPVPLYWPNGTYTVSELAVDDGYGITSFVASDELTPATSFTVVGGAAADLSPKINSITLLANPVAPGGQLTCAVDVAPGTTGEVTAIEIWETSPTDPYQETVTLAPTTPGSPIWSGTVGITFPGSFSVNAVQVFDGFGYAIYKADGTSVSDGVTPTSQGINFASLDFTVAIGPISSQPGTLGFVLQPASISVLSGSVATFYTAVSGQNLTYQWYFNGSPIPGADASAYDIPSAQPSNSGSYALTITGPDGTSLTSNGAVLAVAPASGGPVVSTQPSGATISTGSSVVFNAGASQSGVTYQWYLNGFPLNDGESASVSHSPTARAVSGSSSGTLLLTNTTAADAGSYSCLITNSVGSTLTNSATLNVSSSADPGRLTDLSCRAPVGTGAGTLIAGFATGGSGTSGIQTLLIRGSGPALAQFSLTGLLPDPDLGLFDSQQHQIASNSGWSGSAAIALAASQVGAFAWTSTTSHDSALLQTLSPGSYTAQVSGASGDTGLGLVEVYDDTPAGSYTSTSPRLVNLSARIDSGTGANVLIAGFYIGGTTSKTVLIRGSGPALAEFSLTGLLPDPQLQVFDGSQTLIAMNTGWQANAQISAVAASVGAFSWGTKATPDSALLLTLPHGAYTAQVSGASGDTGVALVEIYDVQ